MASFITTLKNRIGFSLFTFFKLPSLWFWGVRVDTLNEEVCRIKIRYSWFTKNPFQSVYFSALSGAAELSTGLPVQRWATKEGNVSMLVIKSEAHFLKKAKGTIIFECNEVEKIAQTFSGLTKSGDHTELELHSEGRDKNNVIVATFTITWSLKKR